MPEMRAAQLQEDITALVELGSEAAARILADISPVTLRRIQDATRVDWLPVEVDLELVYAVHGVVGDEGLRRWGRAAVRRSLDTNLFRPLLETVVRLFGLSPRALFRAVPQAWRATFRGCGEVGVVTEPWGVRLRLTGLPEALKDRIFLLSVSGSCEAVFDAARVTGEVRLVPSPDAADATFEARWNER
jgi:hypothetical protein